jgi:threonine-phosphate decarboxylase
MIEAIFNTCDSFEHGGNIYRLAEELKMQERKVMDFSASVNPLGVSKKIKTEMRKHLKYLHNYPDPEAKRLRKRLAQYHGIDLETILCGNGSTEFIYLITKALRPQKVLIPAPTFSEYERSVLINQESEVRNQKSETTEQGVHIKYLILKEKDDFKINPDEFITALQTPNPELNTTPCDMAFLCNPNNPTGRLLRGDDVKRIADAAKEFKCYLIVDEAFIDFCADDSVIKDVRDNPYLIVLRSMTGFYALSGLRIGYGIFPQHLVERLKKYKEPWTINNLAQRAAVVALKDKVYRSETFKLIKGEKKFLEKSFRKIGIEFFDSDVNFYLLKINNANELCQQLKRKGILLRDCSIFRGLDSTYLRVAVKSHKENTILIKELTSILPPFSVPPYQGGDKGE